jgi:uncharacterized transporter YbjL
MIDQTLLNLVLALAANELLHNVMEAMNVRHKVRRLHAYIENKPFEEMPMKIDTRHKAYSISLGVFIIVTGVFFAIFSALNLNGNDGLWVAAILLIAAFFSEAYLLDKFHVEIERVTRPFMKKK